MVLGLWHVITAVMFQCGGDAQVCPLMPIDPRVQQRQQELEQLKQRIRDTDAETFRLLAESEERKKGYQEAVEQADKAVREAQYMLAKLKAPRAHPPRPGLVYEYQRMAAEARRAGQRVGP